MALQRTYLALDQSPKLLGYAIGHVAMRAPVSGVYKLTANAEGLMLLDAYNWLRSTIAHYEVEKLAYEGSFLGHNVKAFGMGQKLTGVILLVAAQIGIPTIEIPSDDWRNRFLGFCRASRSLARHKRREWLKQQSMLACAKRRWDVKTHDEAEACGLLDYALAKDHQTYGTTIGTPLFTANA